MVQQFIYQGEDLPEYLKCQILSFIRHVWPDGFQGENRLRDWISREEFHPLSFVLVEEKILISHIEVMWKYVEHNNVTYKTYGLSGVFTYPQFRNQGYGLQLVNEAKKHIEQQMDGDIILFTSRHKGFYEKAGFISMESAKLLKGDPKNPKIDEENIFMLFLSNKGKQGRKDFETKPFYFGETTW